MIPCSLLQITACLTVTTFERENGVEFLVNGGST